MLNYVRCKLYFRIYCILKVQGAVQFNGTFGRDFFYYIILKSFSYEGKLRFGTSLKVRIVTS